MSKANMSFEELKDMRAYLVNDYFYWMSTIEDEYELDIILSEIEEEIKEIENYMKEGK